MMSATKGEGGRFLSFSERGGGGLNNFWFLLNRPQWADSVIKLPCSCVWMNARILKGLGPRLHNKSETKWSLLVGVKPVGNTLLLTCLRAINCLWRNSWTGREKWSYFTKAKLTFYVGTFFYNIPESSFPYKLLHLCSQEATFTVFTFQVFCCFAGLLNKCSRPFCAR